MLRRLIAVTALAAGMSIAAVITLATPALAKGPAWARITGPGLARAVVVSGNGEPGQQGRLASLADQTGLFTVMFGASASASIGGPAPARLHTPPSATSLGPRYTLVYTVPGVTPRPGQQFGRVRQDLYPRAPGGPLIYTPPGQQGFGGPLTVTGWLRGRPQLTRTLAQVGVPPAAGTRAAQQTRRPAAAHPAAAHQAGARTAGWIIASAAVIVAAALGGAALWLRRRRLAAAPGRGSRAGPSGDYPASSA
jgi:hypothetical protein